MEWILGIGAALVLLYEYQKGTIGPAAPKAQPGTTTLAGVSPAGTDYSTTPGSIHADAAMSRGTSTTPDTATYYGQAVDMQSTYNNYGTPTAIPDWLALPIASAFIPAPIVKLAGTTGSPDVTASADISTAVGGTRSTDVQPGGATGPADPSLDPNYDYSLLPWDQQIAATALAGNEAGTGKAVGI